MIPARPARSSKDQFLRSVYAEYPCEVVGYYLRLGGSDSSLASHRPPSGSNATAGAGQSQPAEGHAY
jgi:hypothetical protein